MKRRDFYIRCIKTPVNDRKSKQDKNLQNPLRTRAKKTNEMLENTPCAKIPFTTLYAHIRKLYGNKVVWD